MSAFLIVGEGRSRRFFLTGFSKADATPRFKPGPVGRSSAMRFPDRAAAEAVAASAQRTDRHGLNWRATIA